MTIQKPAVLVALGRGNLKSGTLVDALCNSWLNI